MASGLPRHSQDAAIQLCRHTKILRRSEKQDRPGIPESDRPKLRPKNNGPGAAAPDLGAANIHTKHICIFWSQAYTYG